MVTISCEFYLEIHSLRSISCSSSTFSSYSRRHSIMYSLRLSTMVLSNVVNHLSIWGSF